MLTDKGTFGTLTDSDNVFGAKLGLTEALDSGKAPEQTAADLNFARRLKMPHELVRDMPAEERHIEEVNLQDWASMQATTPVLLQKIADPTFANLVKDDLSNAGLLERLWWKLAPEEGQTEGKWTALRNAIHRGGYQLPGALAQRQLEDVHAQLANLDEQEQALAEGRPIKDIFGSDEDPEGLVGYKYFQANKDAIRKSLIARATENAVSLAFGNSMAAMFPQAKGMQEFSEQKDFRGAMDKFLENPLEIIANVGPESLVRNAPQLAGMALAGGAGAIPGMLAAGVGSNAMEYGASMQDAMGKLGLDTANYQDVLKFYTDPNLSRDYSAAQDRARARASAVAAFDMVSAGIASKSLVPAFMKHAYSARTSELINVANQAVVQGTLGGAGEAAGQITTDGEITSWSDVIAEFAGEFTTAPIDVYAATTKATVTNGLQAQSAQAFAADTAKLESYAQTSLLLTRDPQTFSEYVQAVKEQRPDIQNIYVNAGAVHAAGADSLFSADPALVERYNRAVAEGGDVRLSVEEFLSKVAPQDTSSLLAQHAHPEGLPSLAEAQALETQLSGEITERLNSTLTDAEAEFRRSSATVGETIGRQLRDAFQPADPKSRKAEPGMMTTTQIQTVQAYLQTLVNNMARDTGMLPEKIWNDYGAKGFLSPKDVKRTESGIKAVTDRAKQLLDFHSLEKFSQAEPRLRNALKNVLPQESLDIPENVKDFHVAKPRFTEKLMGKTFTTPDGEQVAISRRTFDKCFNDKSRGKSFDAAIHNTAVLNLDKLLGVSVRGWEAANRKDKGKNSDLTYLKRFAGMVVDGVPYVVKLTLSRNLKNDTGTHAYSVEAIEVESAWQARDWLDAAAKKDEYENAEGAIKAASAGMDVALAGQAIRTGTIAQTTPIDLVDLLGVSRQAEFKQETLGEYLPDQRVIIQWAKANPSTFLHETGHLFLNMRVAIARDLKAQGNLTQEQQAHLQATEDALKWLGTNLEDFSKMTPDEQRPMHEKFARTYEAYLMEGRAPNPALTKIFRRFTSWLKSVYKAVTAIPEAEINDETRAIFDRLLVASSQMEEARARRAQFAIFNSPEEGQMASELWEDYRNRDREAREAAEEELNAKAAKDSKRYANLRMRNFKELSAQAREYRKQIEDEMWDEVRASKAYKANALLTSGKKTDDGTLLKPKLTKRGLKKLKLSEASLKRLEDLELIGKNESDLNEEAIAQACGYDSVDAMVADLLKLGDPLQTINDKVATAMMERYGNLSTPEKIKESADLAAFNEARLLVLEHEVQAFNRAMGKKTANMKQFKLAAKQEIGGYSLGELRSRNKAAVAAAARAHRESAEAMRKGDPVTAAAKKNQELWQATKVKEGKEKFEEIKKAFKRFTNFTKSDEIKGVDASYTIIIQHILAKCGIGKEFTLTDEQKDMISHFMSDGDFKEETGLLDPFDPPIELLRAIENGEYPDLSTMSCWDFAGLVDLIDELKTLGRDAKSMEVEGQRLEFAYIRNALANDIEAQAEKRGRKSKDNREHSGKLASMRDQLAAIGMSHARIPSLLAAAEGTREGDMFKFIIRPAQECDARERELHNKFSEKIYKALKPIMKSVTSQTKKYYDAVGASFSKQEIFVMALNMGNTGNKQRLLDNSDAWSFMNGRKLTEEEVLGMISSTLTAQDLEVVQKVWNLYADMQKLIEAKEVRKRGRAPEWVEATPLQLISSDGQMVQLEGGYYPIVYDPKASAAGKRAQDMTDAQASLRAAKGLAATHKGHLKSRSAEIDAGRPLTLTVRGIFNGFDRSIHDVCWDEWVNNTRCIIQGDGQFDRALRKYWGPEACNAVRQWHMDIATKGEGAKNAGDTLADFLRRGVSLVGVGFNLVTAAIQPLAITQTAAVLGPRWTMKGLGEFFAMGPKGASQFAASKSAVMADRARTQFREVAEIQSLANGNTSELARGFMRAAYFPIVMSQMTVDLPTWLGAYNKALSEGKTDADAVASADRLLLDSQGSGSLMELSGIERGGSWLKLFTTYYTFFNTALQIAMVSGHTKDKMTLARDLMLVLIAQPVAETFLREALKVGPDNDEDDDEYWKRMLLASAGNTVEFNMGLFVGLREAGSMAKGLVTGEREPYRGPTALRKLTDTTDFLGSVRKAIENGELDERVIRQAITVTADWTGWPIPNVPITRAIKGYNAIKEGKTDNPAAYFLGYSDY